MSDCCGGRDLPKTCGDPAAPVASSCCGSGGAAVDESCPLTYFGRMIPHCLEFAQAAKAQGKPIVGIMCEYTPRELIMAAGGVPVCLCGGDAAQIPAAEDHLPANLCPLVKSTYGYHVNRSNPFLEMANLVVAETTCDAKKKMYELMGERTPMYILELPQKQGDAESRAYWIEQLRRFRMFLEEEMKTTITDEGLREAVCAMNRERRLRRDLAAVMKRPAPPITGRQLLDLKSSISCIEADLAQYEKALEMLDGQAGPCAMRERARVLMTGVPVPHGAERVVDIIEQNGGLVVAMENCTGLKPILEDVSEDAEDILEAIADKYYHLPCSVMTRNDDRLESLRALAKEYRAECVIELVWQACLTYDVESYLVKRFVESELRLPYLRIETDYAPADSARIAVRIEALFETLHSKREVVRA